MGGSRFVRRAVTAVTTALVVVVCAAPGSAAPPTNDSLATPHDIQLQLNGVRALASDATLGGAAVFGVDTSEATTTPEEPVLAVANETSACNDVAVQGSDTVFYRLRQNDGGPLRERTLVTLDTTDTSYSTAIVVFKAAVDRPIPESTVIRCERANLVGGAATTTFVTEVGFDYFVEIASVGGVGTMNLFVRATDVQPPMLTLTASPALGSPNGTTTFTVVETEDGSGKSTGGFDWKAYFTPDGGTRTERPVLVAPEGDEATVRWPPGTVPGQGEVVVRKWDVAGNVGRASVRIRVRDRTPPTITQSGYRRETARRRIAAWIRCDEAGTASITLRASGSRPKFARALKVRKGVRRTVVFRAVRVPSVFQLEYTCEDRAANTSATRYRVDLIGF